jgi:hypothetical protein
MLSSKRIRPRGSAEADLDAFKVHNVRIYIMRNLIFALHASTVSCACLKTLFKVDQARYQPSDALYNMLPLQVCGCALCYLDQLTSWHNHNAKSAHQSSNKIPPGARLICSVNSRRRSEIRDKHQSLLSGALCWQCASWSTAAAGPWAISALPPHQTTPRSPAGQQ